MKVLRLLSVFLLSAAFSTAFAAPSAYWQKGPCGEDVKKYCMEAPAGAVIQCLREHEHHKSEPLTESCRQKFAEKRGDDAAAQPGTSEKNTGKKK